MILHTFYFGHFRHACPVPSTMIVLTCRRLWCLFALKINLIPPFFPESIARILQTCYFEYFGHDWPCPPKLIASYCCKFWCLSTWKSQLHPSLLSSDFANILQIAILDTFNIPDYGQENRWYQLVENVGVYPHAKTSNLSIATSRDFTKIW